jgi:cyclopropane fatty-acyl-phospholipid synthase-like methyltransferase
METMTVSAEKLVKAKQLTPEHILQVGMGFWASKTLLSAVDLKLFTLLANKPRTAIEIKQKLELHERSYLDFLDALVALGFLERIGIGSQAVYSNAPETDFFLDKNKHSYIGGILEMSNNRLYKFWNNLEEALRTGQPQNELKDSNSKNQFYDFYSNDEARSEFLSAMAGLQMGAFFSLCQQFDFSKYSSFCDAGGGSGALCIQVARHYPQIKCINFDLPEAEPEVKKSITESGLSSRISIISGDFFKDDFPKSDVIAMGNVLHDWSEKEKLLLIKKAYDALPEGGAFICIENIIDNNRNKNVLGLLMSLNMLIETREGFDFTFNDFDQWAYQTGFKKTDWLSLIGPTSAAIAFK